MPIPSSGTIKFSDFYAPPAPVFDISMIHEQSTQYSSYTFHTYTNPFTSGNGRLVVIYNQVNSVGFRGDYQLDYITLGSNTYSFEGSSDGFEHIKKTSGWRYWLPTDAASAKTIWDQWEDGSADNGWLEVPYTGHHLDSGIYGGWQRYSGSTPSGSTGIYGAANGNQYLYTEMTYNRNATKILRSPQFTFLSNQTISWYDGAYGSNMGTRRFYIIQEG